MSTNAIQLFKNKIVGPVSDLESGTEFVVSIGCCWMETCYVRSRVLVSLERGQKPVE